MIVSDSVSYTRKFHAGLGVRVCECPEATKPAVILRCNYLAGRDGKLLSASNLFVLAICG